MNDPIPGNATFQQISQQISLAHNLTMKAMESNTIEELIFTLVNDTSQLIPYDRAILWQVHDQQTPQPLGVSKEAASKTTSELIQTLSDLIGKINRPDELRSLKPADFPGKEEIFQEYQKTHSSSILWVPIWEQGGSRICLWLEKTGVSLTSPYFNEDTLCVFQEYLIPGYKAAWEKIAPVNIQTRLSNLFAKKNIALVSLALIFLSLYIHVPLRIVASCEVVAVDPYLIAAPVKGIIGQIIVKPGQEVAKGALLYEYDRREAEHDLLASQKKVEIVQSELLQAMSQHGENQPSADELATANFRLKKEMVELNYAKYRASLLLGHSPVSGVAVVDNPDNWQGRPVNVGEKIMFIADPKKTQVKVWIAEADNVLIHLPTSLEVYLNPFPEVTLHATLKYVSQEPVLTGKGSYSFVGEADWVGEAREMKLGLKGNAVLYGENVSLMYYVLRKSIYSFRHFFGF